MKALFQNDNINLPLMVFKWCLRNLDCIQNYANPWSIFWTRKCRQHLKDKPML